MMMTDRATRLLKLLKRMLKQEHLYTDEQLKEIKNNIRSVEEELNRIKVETSKGFKKQFYISRIFAEVCRFFSSWCRDSYSRISSSRY
jgi:hypothetical protein